MYGKKFEVHVKKFRFGPNFPKQARGKGFRQAGTSAVLRDYPYKPFHRVMAPPMPANRKRS